MCKPTLEFFYQRPVIRQPAAVEKVVDALQEATSIADIGPPYVYWGSERWRAAADGQFRNEPLHFSGAPQAAMSRQRLPAGVPPKKPLQRRSAHSRTA
jgi:hypothetical protein